MATTSIQSTKGKWLMGSAILASSMSFIDSTALNVVLPSLQKNLNASGTDLFWILNAYLLMLASLIIIGGAMGDKLGRKRVFMTGICIFILGSLACGFAPNVNILVFCRVLQGIGGALMIPGSLSLISSSIITKERGKAIGTWSAFTTVITVGGPILGGALADAGLWRFIFFINVPIGIVALIMLWFKVEETSDPNNDQPLDFPGAIVIALGLLLLTFGFLREPAKGLYHWQVLGSLVSGISLLLLFVWIEYKSKNPMMPLRLFSNATFSGANLLTFFLYAGLGAGMLFLTLNLVQAQGYSQFQAGLTLLPFTLLMISVSRFAGSLADRYGPRKLLIIGPTVAGGGFMLLSFVKQTHGPADYWTTFLPGILVFALGMSLTVAPLTAAVMSSVEDTFSGTASGINNSMTRISNVFANAIFGALAVLFFSTALEEPVKKLPMSINDRQMVMAQTANLGNAKVSSTLNSRDIPVIEEAYHIGFIYVYTRIMRISAYLCFLGAFMGFLFIRNKPVTLSSHDSSV